MCQFVAISKHLFKCRYECQNFGFWGLFLAGRFCVYITQMNFLFCPFSYLIFILFYFVLLSPIRAACPIVFCAYCQPGRGGVTFDTLVNVPRYHVTTIFAIADLKTYHVVKLFCGRRFCSCWGVHRRPPAGVVNTFKLTC